MTNNISNNILNWNEIETYLFDLDGSIYVDNKATNGAVELVKYLKNIGKKILFLTNNSTDTLEEITERLIRLEFFVDKDEIISSASISGEFIAETFGISDVYFIGAAAVRKYLTGSGHKLISGRSLGCDIVLTGRDLHFNYKKIKKAVEYIDKGAKFITTNPDYFHPGSNGLKNIETGALASSIQKATGIKPITIGKPSSFIFRYALKRAGTSCEKAVMIGDNPDTDVLGGKSSGLKTVQIIYGEFNKDEKNHPDYYCNELSELLKMIS